MPVVSPSLARIALATLLVSICALPCSALTLVSRSSGLELPLKEEGCTELETGDVNGDGNLDLASVGDHGNPNFNSDEHGIMVWLGDGAGGWTVHQTGDFGYGGCAVGDLDRDGRLDLAWGIHHNYGSGMGSRLISAARGDGSGLAWTDWGAGLATNGESYGMFATALADWDGDGRLDIVSQSFGGSNGLQLYQNHGDGTWSSAWALTGGTVQYTVESCDFNADGYADIICTRSGTNALQGDGAFGFTPAVTGLPSGTVRCVDAGDMNGDGREDMVFGLGSAGLRCYFYAPAPGSWQDASTGLPASGTFTMAQFGDLNGDGSLDIVGYAAPTGRVYLGDGTGHWTADATWTMPSPGNFSALRIDGDLDHDGREDIFVQATQSGFPFYRNQLRAYSPWTPPATLAARLVTPRGGETLRVGSIRDIRWLAAVPQSFGPASVELRLSVSGPTGPWTTIASDLPDNGRYEWQVYAQASSAQCRIEAIVSTPGHSVTAVSPGDFTILWPEGSGVRDLPGTPAAGGSLFVLCPNPAGNETVLRWVGHSTGALTFPEAFAGRVLLFDLGGRMVRAWNGVPAGGLRLHLLDAAGRALARGIYILRVDRAGQVDAIRLVKK